MKTLPGYSPVLLISLVGKDRVDGDSSEAADTHTKKKIKSADAFYLKLKTDRADHTGLVRFLSDTTATNLNVFSSRAAKKEFLYFLIVRVTAEVHYALFTDHKITNYFRV